MSIIEKLVTDIKRVFDFTDERHHPLVTCFSIQTHLIDVFDYSPALHTRGMGDGSEIACGEVLEVICQNPIQVGYMTNGGLIATMNQEPPPTLLFGTNGVERINKDRSRGEIISVSNRKTGEARVCDKRGEVVKKKIYCSKIFFGREDISDPEVAATSLTVKIKKSPFPLERFENIKKEFEDDHGAIKSLCEAHADDFKTAYSNFPQIEGIDGFDWLRWKSILTIAQVLDSLGETHSLFNRLLGLAQDTIRARLEEIFFSDIKTRVLYLTLDFIKNKNPDAFYPAEQIPNHIQEHGGIKMKTEQVGRILNGCEGVIKERVSKRIPWETTDEKKTRLKNLKIKQGLDGTKFSPVAQDSSNVKKRLKVFYRIDKKALEKALSDKCGDISRFVREEN